jgi:hypothetical protein
VLFIAEWYQYLYKGVREEVEKVGSQLTLVTDKMTVAVRRIRSNHMAAWPKIEKSNKMRDPVGSAG